MTYKRTFKTSFGFTLSKKPYISKTYLRCYAGVVNSQIIQMAFLITAKRGLDHLKKACMFKPKVLNRRRMHTLLALVISLLLDRSSFMQLSRVWYLANTQTRTISIGTSTMINNRKRSDHVQQIMLLMTSQPNPGEFSASRFRLPRHKRLDIYFMGNGKHEMKSQNIGLGEI